MAKYDGFALGFAKESTYGTAVITGATSTSYRLGICNDDVELPDPKIKMLEIIGDASKYDPTDYIKQQFDLRRTINVLPVDGVLLYYIMGSTSTAGSDPYTHTITRIGAGGELPSMNIHQDYRDSTATLTDYGVNYLGVKVPKLVVACDPKGPAEGLLLFTLNLMAKDAATTAWVLDSTHQPDWHNSAHNTPYKWGQLYFEYDSTDITDTMLNFDLTLELPHQYLTMPRLESAVDKSHIPYQCLAKPKGVIMLRFQNKPDTLNKAIYDEAIARTSGGKDAEIKFTRSANDYIKFTLTNAHIFEPRLVHPSKSGFAVEEYTMHFESISIEVKDSITSTPYGG